MNSNAIAAALASAAGSVFSALAVDEEKFIKDGYHVLLAESFFVLPILLFYAYETRYVIVLLVFFVYALAAFPKIRDSPHQRWLRLYVVLFLWFMLSKLWSGPSYYSDCLWRERDQESRVIAWMLYASVAAQGALLFAPPHAALNYLWILNYVYPAMSMVSTCSNLLLLLVRGALLILMWMCTPDTIKVRAVGLFLVTSWQGWPFFFAAWGGALYVRRERKELY